jgi:acetyltransferase-like isoleucine patch superfamily enzyme
MNFNRKLFAYFFIILLSTTFVFAQKTDSFTLSDEYGENLYVTNSQITIDSNLYGDLFAFSENIIVNALVQQDINAVSSGTFELQGTVGSDLRLIASKTIIDGTIFGETLILGDFVNITENTQIGNYVRINANTVFIDGTLKDDVQIKAEKVVLNGIIEGNAIIYSSSLELGPNARILGDLSSTRSIDGMSSKVDGIVTKLEGKEDPDNFTAVTFQKIGIFITIFLIGAFVLLVARKFTARTVLKMGSRFFVSFLLGLVALIVTPFVAVALIFTIVGIPISILLFLIYALAIILAIGMSAHFLGSLLLRIGNKRNRNVWISLLLGSLLMALLTFIPVAFWIAAFLLMLISIGAGLLAIFSKDKARVR